MKSFAQWIIVTTDREHVHVSGLPAVPSRTGICYSLSVLRTGGCVMDEYSPKKHDIAQLKFLCETLYHDCLATLEESNHGWVNDPTSAVNLQLNELIEHIATFALNYKIKYDEDNKLIAQIDEYLDDTFMLFSNYGINSVDLQKWRKSGNKLFRCFVNASRANPVSLSC